MFSRSRSALLASVLVLLASCSSSDHDSTATPSVPVPALAKSTADTGVRAFVAHRDRRATGSGAPSFVWLSKTQGTTFSSADEASLAALGTLKKTFALDDAAFSSLTEGGIDSSSIGPIIKRYVQRDARGIEVFRAGLNIALSRAFDPVSASGLIAPTLAGADKPFARSTHDAVGDAFATLNLGTSTFTSIGTANGGYERFTAAGLRSPARVKKVLYPSGTGVVPAYYVEIQITRGPSRSMVVSALDGHLLFTNDLVRHDKFAYRVFADPTTMVPADGPQGNGDSPSISGVPDDFKPTFGSSQVVTLQNYPFSKNDPWLASGATVTSGNNVNAYPDLHAPDGIGGDANPVVSSPGQFDYTYDPTQNPDANLTNTSAASTHLFYLTNYLHDVYYDLGFDEASGNHQVDNFGRGGIGNDPLLAESEDYSGTDNANASTPADGESPRLQMYQWTGPASATLTVETPASIAGAKAANTGGFGASTFDFSGPVVLVDDGQGADPHDGCATINADLTGQIALIHRGTCAFVTKVQNAQTANAMGVIIANVASSDTPDTAPNMGPAPETQTTPLTIAAISLSYPDGAALEAALSGGATVHMHRDPTINLDGSIDTSVPSHEWGHVLSNRLINDANGITTNQSMGLGEGWADSSAMLVMVRADDIQSPHGADWQGGYIIGGWAGQGQGAPYYFGIRRVPYSIDFSKDPLTFQDISDGTPLPTTAPIAYGADGSMNSEVHATGEIWATMLWECYSSLLRDGRFSFADAQTRWRRYLVASLKLTPTDPTLLEARDAVLAAALATDATDYSLFWAAFARRGAGVGAIGPDKDSTDNTGVVESYSTDNDVLISGGSVSDDVVTCDHDGYLDDGEIGELTFDVLNAGPGPLTAPFAFVSSDIEGVTFPEGPTATFAALAPLTGLSTTVKIKVQIAGLAKQTSVPFTVSVGDASFKAGHFSQYTFTVRAQVDQAADSSAIDHVDTARTSWKVDSVDDADNALDWGRVQSATENYWTATDPYDQADLYLESPPFTMNDGATSFELKFKHRYSFRISTRRMTDVDGGVVEISIDNGATWIDASKFGAVDYNGTIDTGGRGDNTLGGSMAYTGNSAGYPDAWVNADLKLDLKAHPASVRVRFHLASASGFSDTPGWDVTDIELLGTPDTPFWSYVDDANICDANAPTADAGPVLTVTEGTKFGLDGTGTSPSGAPLSFVWAQIDGPVALPFPVTAGSPHADYIAPSQATPVTLTFELRANDGTLDSAGARTTVNVVPVTSTDSGCSTSRRTPGHPATGAFAAAGLASLAMLAALLRGRRRARP